jgi:hypothetical protein
MCRPGSQRLPPCKTRYWHENAGPRRGTPRWRQAVKCSEPYMHVIFRAMCVHLYQRVYDRERSGVWALPYALHLRTVWCRCTQRSSEGLWLVTVKLRHV